MKFIRSLSVLVLFLILTTSQIYAVRAYPYPVKVKQPDGSEITIQLKGDEFFHYKSTLDGHPLVHDTKGFLTYAFQDEKGIFHSTGFRASEILKRSTKEKQFIQTLKPVMDVRKVILSKRAVKSSLNKSNSATSSQKAYPLSGTPKSLVILVNFTDTSFVVSNPQTAFTNMLNQSGYSANGGTGSAKDYFTSNSMGVFSPQFDVVGPVALPHPMNYYGRNDSSGDDTNPIQMVVDACTAANRAGVDFTKYDTDNDGVIDNVFVYYAGYNEAENGPDNSIWPHRWAVYPNSMFSKGNYSGTIASITFDSKRLMDYACSSELKGSSGTNMCGVGTFCHEFSHVLGLDDLYATDGGTQHTPSSWDVMDYGPYLNGGRTPCGYSSYERFFLGWLTPTELKSEQDVTLNNLSTSNQAYLISQYGNHNLNGANPNPVEFFMLENRQKTGWDAYLPGSGLLVTHVYYNASNWENNSPNNDPNAMGVDIVEADGIATDGTLSGDTYPGTSNISYCTPLLRNGTNIRKPLTDIKSTNGIISFHFMGIAPVISTTGTLNTFTTVFGTPTSPQTINIKGTDLYNDIIISFSNDIHFQMRKAGTTQWTDTIRLTPSNYNVDENIEIRYNPKTPSKDSKHFDAVCINTVKANTLKVSLYGISSPNITVPVAQNAQNINYTSFTACWQSVVDATGYYLNVYKIQEGQSSLSEEFDNGLTAPADWEITATGTTTLNDQVGLNSPAILFSGNGEYLKTEKYVLPVTSLSFYIHSIATTGGFLIEGQNGNNEWSKIDSIVLNTSVNNPAKTYNFPESKDYHRFRFISKSAGKIAFDDLKVSFNKLLTFELKNSWEKGTSVSIDNLIPGTEYLYSVKASDKSIYYENITEPSNLITAKTLNIASIFKSERDSQIVYKTIEGDIIFKTMKTNEKVSIYNILGQAVIPPFVPESDVVTISSLPRNNIYIVRIGRNSIKIRL